MALISDKFTRDKDIILNYDLINTKLKDWLIKEASTIKQKLGDRANFVSEQHELKEAHFKKSSRKCIYIFKKSDDKPKGKK